MLNLCASIVKARLADLCGASRRLHYCLCVTTCSCGEARCTQLCTYFTGSDVRLCCGYLFRCYVRVRFLLGVRGCGCFSLLSLAVAKRMSVNKCIYFIHMLVNSTDVRRPR